MNYAGVVKKCLHSFIKEIISGQGIIGSKIRENKGPNIYVPAQKGWDHISNMWQSA